MIRQIDTVPPSRPRDSLDLHSYRLAAVGVAIRLDIGAPPPGVAREKKTGAGNAKICPCLVPMTRMLISSALGRVSEIKLVGPPPV